MISSSSSIDRRPESRRSFTTCTTAKMEAVDNLVVFYDQCLETNAVWTHKGAATHVH